MAIVGNAISTVTLKALIHVTTKPGATVTFKKGSTTMATKIADGGVAELEVLSGDWGSWTISCSWSQSGISNAATGSGSTTLSAPTTYNVNVPLTWYVIQNGNFTGFGHKVVGWNGTRSVFEDSGDYIWLSDDIYAQSSNRYASGYFTNAISVNDWKTMYIDFEGRGEDDHMGLVTDTSLQQASFTNSVQLVYQQQNYSSRGTKSLDISGATGTRYVGLRVRAFYSEYRHCPGDLRIYNLYLRS